MNAKELRQKDLGALQQELSERLREQFNLRMQQGSGQLPRHHLLRAVRRDIARINTVMKEIESAGAKS